MGSVWVLYIGVIVCPYPAYAGIILVPIDKIAILRNERPYVVLSCLILTTVYPCL
jgi:hypothetical protein